MRQSELNSQLPPSMTDISHGPVSPVCFTLHMAERGDRTDCGAQLNRGAPDLGLASDYLDITRVIIILHQGCISSYT